MFNMNIYERGKERMVLFSAPHVEIPHTKESARNGWHSARLANFSLHRIMVIEIKGLMKIQIPSAH